MDELQIFIFKYGNNLKLHTLCGTSCNCLKFER